jgi:hypothetical protein
MSFFAFDASTPPSLPSCLFVLDARGKQGPDLVGPASLNREVVESFT